MHSVMGAQGGAGGAGWDTSDDSFWVYIRMPIEKGEGGRRGILQAWVGVWVAVVHQRSLGSNRLASTACLFSISMDGFDFWEQSTTHNFS